jgi:hypothetical protein
MSLQLEDDLTGSLTAVEALIAGYHTTGTPTGLSDARTRLVEAKALLGELDRDLFMVPVNDRERTKRRYKELGTRITTLEDQVDQAQKRVALLGSAHNVRQSAAVDTSLAQTAEYGAESVELGQRILADLGDQRAKLQNAQGNLDSIHSSVANTGKLVGKMTQVQNRNLMMRYCALSLIILAIGMVLYLKFF